MINFTSEAMQKFGHLIEIPAGFGPDPNRQEFASVADALQFYQARLAIIRGRQKLEQIKQQREADETVAQLDSAASIARALVLLWRKDRGDLDDLERLLATMGRTRNIAKAIRAKFANPSMNQTEVADEVGCDRSLLSGSPLYKKLAQEIERSAGRKANIIRRQGLKRGQRRRPKSSEIHTENSKS